MEWHIKKFQELTNRELYALLKARLDVFVVEQDCAYSELDDYDQGAIHYYGTIDGEIAVNVRMLPKGLKYQETSSIGRVLVVEGFRGNGYARIVMEKAIDFITKEWKEKRIKIQAQTYLKDFYSSLGFTQISEPYVEDGIPHIDMVLEMKLENQ